MFCFPVSPWKRDCPANGYTRDPKDCNVFYFCAGPIRYKFHCAAGLAFDPDKNQCEYPEVVSGCWPTLLNIEPTYTKKLILSLAA